MTESDQLKTTGLEENQSLFRKVAVFGATGSIGDALCRKAVEQNCDMLFRFYRNQSKLRPKAELIGSNTNPSTVIEDRYFTFDNDANVENILSAIDEPLDLIVITTGWLHDSNHKPEKSIAELDYSHSHKSWLINFFGPSQILKSIYNYQRQYKSDLVIAVLSARLGSISDNCLGGWHSYRSSKASLNMMVKNFAIETNRQRLPWISVAVQPGTTQSLLSAPYSKNVKSLNIQTPEFTANSIWSQLSQLDIEQHNGLFIDFEGNIIDP